MAYDLILGQTSRDWSIGNSSMCGSSYALDPGTSSFDQNAREYLTKDSVALGKAARDEIDKNTREAIRLTNDKRLPEVDRKAFGAFFKKWLAFNESKKGKFVGSDYVAILNFREANKRFTERLAVFAQLAAIPLKTPVAPLPSSTAMTVPAPAKVKPPAFPWGFLMGLSLGLVGLKMLPKMGATAMLRKRT
jgi:hypothetical protein